MLYRTSAGSPAALEDTCPHRLTPLSMGRLRGDTIECGYHGMTFNCRGECVRIPGQDNHSAQRAGAVLSGGGEHGVGLDLDGGSGARQPVSSLDLPQYHAATWSAVEGDALRIDCHYLSLADNLCDPAHVSFVHLSTLGNPEGEDVPVHSEKTGENTLVTWRWISTRRPFRCLQSSASSRATSTAGTIITTPPRVSP